MFRFEQPLYLYALVLLPLLVVGYVVVQRRVRTKVASWGDTKLTAHGLGAYIAKATDEGNFAHVVLGVAVMSIFVLGFNRVLWRPLYAFATRRLTL